jgi:hypothetical protein
MVISTIANYSDNLTLLEYVRGLRTRPRTIFTSQRRSEALRLYEAGANYLIVPEVVAGEHIKHLLSIYGLKGKRLTKAGKSHFRRLIFS